MQMVNKCGTTVNEYSYDEWGNNTSQTEGIEEPAGCNARGKEWNRQAGRVLIDLRVPER